MKGLKNILYSEKKKCQSEITNFISYCKCHEDQNGLIQNTFFKERISDKGKILNGPFNDYIFSLILPICSSFYYNFLCYELYNYRKNKFNPKKAKSIFGYSILYLFLIFVLFLIDKIL